MRWASLILSVVAVALGAAALIVALKMDDNTASQEGVAGWQADIGRRVSMVEGRADDLDATVADVVEEALAPLRDRQDDLGGEATRTNQRISRVEGYLIDVVDPTLDLLENDMFDLSGEVDILRSDIDNLYLDLGL
jgi:hypothetical protein